MRPGKSINSIGMYLQPSRHLELLELSWILNSWCTHRLIACATPETEDLVVKGYDEISSEDRVAELKKVV